MRLYVPPWALHFGVLSERDYMKFAQIMPPFHRLAYPLKADGKIVCANATVVEDSKGEISWFDNDKPLCVAAKEE